MRRSSVALLALALIVGPRFVSAQRVAASRSLVSGGSAVADPSSASAPAPHATATVARAIHAAAPPVLDGRDDDPVWAGAQLIDQFRQFDPVEGGDPRFRTQARIAYDEHDLYVFVRAFDPHPDSIVARLGRRDSNDNADQLLVFIDGYHDRRTAFGFFVNAAGVKLDENVYADGNEDPSWDGVWDVATRIDSLGWTAEFRIPLSQIRYPRAERHTFGFAVARKIARFNETDSWPLVRKSRGGLVSQFGDLEGIDGISSPRQLEVSPYTVAKTYNAPLGTGYAQRSTATAGADIKYGLTSNLTLDATVNPDFGQVEADPSVLNLTGVETFFPEKRPFFLEGQGLFSFDTNCNDGVCSGLFYSRRIGRAPQLGDTYADSLNPTTTPILGAGKLTGKLSNGVSIGLLEAATGREASPGGQTIEPRTNFLVATTGREFAGGASGISVMGTAVNRQLDSWSEPYLRRAAYAGGVQFRQQFLQRNYELSGYYAQSLVEGSAQAIAATQTSMVHDFQRPGNAVRFDSLRTSLAGNSAQLLLNKRGGDFTRFSLGYQWISPGFEINDVGFLGQANTQSQFFWYQVQGNTPRGIYRNFRANLNQWASWTADGLRTDVGGNVNFHMTLKNMWSVHVGQNADDIATSYCRICTRGGPALRQSPNMSGWVAVDGDDRRSIVPELMGMWSRGDEGRSKALYFDPSVHFRIASRFGGGIGMGLHRDINDAQPNGNYGAIGSDTTHYTVAHLDQKTLGVTARLDFTATPTLSLQVYASPFVTAGHFTDWRELANPTAADYASRFRPYAGGDPGGFEFQQFRSNIVLRWEYRPGSVLYVVWAQQRTQSISGTDLAPFSAGDDYRALFGQHPGNVFLVKGSYWVSF